MVWKPIDVVVAGDLFGFAVALTSAIRGDAPDVPAPGSVPVLGGAVFLRLEVIFFHDASPVGIKYRATPHRQPKSPERLRLFPDFAPKTGAPPQKERTDQNRNSLLTAIPEEQYGAAFLE